MPTTRESCDGTEKNPRESTAYAEMLKKSPGGAGGSSSSSRASSKKDAHLQAMLQSQEKVASVVYAKRIVGWRMRSDDDPIEFALREYKRPDEYDLEKEPAGAAAAAAAAAEGFVAGFNSETEGIRWAKIDDERVYTNGARELFSFLFQVRERANSQ